MNKLVILVISLAFVFGALSTALADVDINNASISELQSLPSIGPGLAQAIIDYREAFGPFGSINEITNVPRIGHHIFLRIKDLITIGSGYAAASTVDTDSSAADSTLPGYKPIVKPTSTPEPSVDEIMANFSDEPSIREVQMAAIRFAEINPARFAQWRKKVKERGLWPERLQITVGHDTDDDEDYTRSKTVGVSSGTAYVGPDDETWGWDVDNDWDYELRMQWNLQDYCFHNDILKVSSETEDQVTLRQEILQDVTKLYFDRRRLQVEIILQPNASIALKMKRALKLEEFTAAIDALTDGFFSDSLTEKKK